jgi:hypothetical protein
VEIVITESQLKKIISEATETNATYTTTQDNYFTSDSGNKIKIPKGTKFTAHYWNNKNIASVDRIEGGKNVPSTIFYCGTGRFYNRPSNANGTEKSKTLSNVLLSKVCGQANLDKKSLTNKYDKTSTYKNTKGETVPYSQSVAFEYQKKWLMSKGFFNVDQQQIEIPVNQNHHTALVVLQALRMVTLRIERVTNGNTGCMSYDQSTEKQYIKPGSTIERTDSSRVVDFSNATGRSLAEKGKKMFKAKYKKGYAGVYMGIEFIAKYSDLVKDANTLKDKSKGYKTPLFPDGYYSFWQGLYGNDKLGEVLSQISTKPIFDCSYERYVEVVKPVTDWLSDKHNQYFLANIAAAFTGPFAIPLFIALGTTEAARYYKEGKPGMATVTFVLSFLPLASKLPFVKKYADATFKTLSKKIISKLPLDKAEGKLWKDILKYQNKIKAEIQTAKNETAGSWWQQQTQGFKKNFNSSTSEGLTDVAKNELISKGRDFLINYAGVPTKGSTTVKHFAKQGANPAPPATAQQAIQAPSLAATSQPKKSGYVTSAVTKQTKRDRG